MNLRAPAALVGVTLLGGAAASSLVAQRPDLSGRWTFDAAHSDNPRDMLQVPDSAGGQARGGRPGGYPGTGRGRGGFGGRGGSGRGREGGAADGMSDEQRQRMRQTLQLMFRAPAVVTIVQTDSSMTLAPDSGAPLLLRSDGRQVIEKVDGGGDVKITGHWQGNDFVVEREVSGGGRVTEDYLRSPDGKQLYVIVGFEGGRGRSVAFRRVYDGAPAR